MSNRKGAVSKKTKEVPFQTSTKTTRTPPKQQNQGNVSTYLCQICLVEDGEEKVRCDGCDQWYHFACGNISNDVANHNFWICKNCPAQVSQFGTVQVRDNEGYLRSIIRCDRCTLWCILTDEDANKGAANQECCICHGCASKILTEERQNPTGAEPNNLVNTNPENRAGFSNLPPSVDQVFENQPPTAGSTTSKSRKSIAYSVTSSVSRKAALALQRLEEERQLIEQRTNEAQDRQHERDKEYLNQKYSILEDDVASNISFDDRGLDQEKFDSTRRWAENIPTINDLMSFKVPAQNSTIIDNAVGEIPASLSNQVETNGVGQSTLNNDEPISGNQVLIQDKNNELPEWLTNPTMTVKSLPHPWEYTLQTQSSNMANAQSMPATCVALATTIQTSAVQSNQMANLAMAYHYRRIMNNITKLPPKSKVITSTVHDNAQLYPVTTHQNVAVNCQSTLQPYPSNHQVISSSTYQQNQGMQNTFSSHSSAPQITTYVPQVQSSSSNHQINHSQYQQVVPTMSYQSVGYNIQSSPIYQPMYSGSNQTTGLSGQNSETTPNCQPNGSNNQVMSQQPSTVPTYSTTQPTRGNQHQPLYQPLHQSLHQPSMSQYASAPNGQPLNTTQSMQTHNNGYTMNQGNVTIPSRLTAEQIASRHVMPKDLPYFNGNPLQWLTFISAYENSTETCGYTNSENLSRLQKCLKGDAETAVRSRLIHKDSVPGVIHTLRLMYGRPELIIETMVEDVQKLPPPRNSDLPALIKFAIAVQNLSATIQEVGAVEHLRNPMLINTIIDKLPAQHQLNWAYHKQAIGNAHVGHLGDWLYQIADAASQVVRVSSKQNNVRKQDPKDSTNKSNSAKVNQFLNTQVENTSKKSYSKYESTKSCPACNSSSCMKLANCKKFKDASRADRWIIVKNNYLCGRCFGRHKFYRCESEAQCTVEGCKSNHHTLLHNYDMVSTSKCGEQSPKSRPPKSKEKSSSNADTNTCNSQRSKVNQRTDKFRIVPVMLHYKNKSVRDYAYLDDGSNMTTMEDSLADELGLTGSSKELCVDWAFGQTHSTVDSRIVSMGISGYYDNAPRFKMNNVRTVKHLHLPTQSITTSWIDQYPHFKNVPIATYESVKPRLLIGLQYSKLIVSLETIEGRENEPIVCKTRLGWVVQGPTYENDEATMSQKFSLNMCECQSNDNELHQLVKDYFAMENLGVTIPEKLLESKEVQRANKILESTTIKKGNRYETGLLWKYDDVELPDSYNMALKRLVCLEAKMAKNPELKANLFNQIKTFVQKKYIRKLSPDEIANCKHRVWYLPTFPVFNPKKPEKVRLVWDGAAKVKNTSLNSNLLVGPDELVPLPDLLRRFRERAVPVTGDIEEMYHQVQIRESDQHVQRFLWRENPSDEPDIYVMMVMTFGSRCSPSTAQFIKNKNASEFQENFPRAAESIIDNHYVDDMIDCTHTVNEAHELVRDVKMIHQAEGFNIRNFASSSNELLKKIGGNSKQQSKNLNIENKLGTERVLGMFWDMASDCFTFSLKFTTINEKMMSGEYRPTKREVLRILMSVFDPLGLLANFLVYGKILLQEIWRSKIEWDEKLTDTVHVKWTQWIKALLNVEKLRIPRLYSTKLSPELPKSIQLHTFVDASEACAAVTYLRIEDDEGVDCCIVGAKTKVAPNKPMTVPRLELQAAVLGTRLADTVKKSQRLTLEKHVYWTDSQTVMAWIHSEVRRYNQFVSFRIGEILESTEPNQWRWVPSKQNVADEATKSKEIPTLSSDSRWYKAPRFLYDEERTWFNEDIDFNTEEELRPCFVMSFREIQQEQLINVERFSQWNRLVHTQAYVFRFIHNSRSKREDRLVGPLSQEELIKGENCLYQRAQRDCFFDEILVLKYNENVTLEEQKQFDKSSELRTFSPYLDDNNVLRMRGRTDAATVISQETKRPIILPRRHRITMLLVDCYHRRYKHLNHQTAMNEIRQKYVVPALRVVMKGIRTSCQKCKNEAAKPVIPEMAELPPARLAAFSRPFTFSGVDYFGPYQVKINRSVVPRYGVLIYMFNHTSNSSRSSRFTQHQQLHKSHPKILCTSRSTKRILQ